MCPGRDIGETAVVLGCSVSALVAKVRSDELRDDLVELAEWRDKLGSSRGGNRGSGGVKVEYGRSGCVQRTLPAFWP